jgi:hypothetical protein
MAEFNRYTPDKQLKQRLAEKKYDDRTSLTSYPSHRENQGLSITRPTERPREKGGSYMTWEDSLKLKYAKEIKFITEHGEPTDPEKAIPPGTRVVNLGEDHLQLAHKKEAGLFLGSLKDMGFTHFGIEMVDADDQQLLETYLVTHEGREQLIENINKSFGYRDESGASYLDLIDTAYALGYSIRTIDLSIEEQKKIKAKNELYDDRPWLEARDKAMAKSVGDILDDDPHNQVVTFVGSKHGSKKDAHFLLHKGKIQDSPPTMTQLLASDGIPVSSVRFVSGERGDRGLSQAIYAAGRTDERFMFPDSNSAYDWNVHVPADEGIEQGRSAYIKKFIK